MLCPMSHRAAATRTAKNRTGAQAADIGEHDALRVAVRDAAAPLVAAEGRVEAVRVHRPLPHVHTLRPAPVAPEDALFNATAEQPIT